MKSNQELTLSDFQRARRRAFFQDILATLSGRSNKLLAWGEVCDQLCVGGQLYRGLQAVPVAQIVGSVNRYRDFDRGFLPLQTHTAARWRSIDRAFYDEATLPPVKHYKLDQVYFVMDGNHRVSVARERGQEFVDAEVIEARSRIPVGADLNADDLEIKGEYAEFLERTRLDELRPDQKVEFTIGGGYRRLIEHIAVHRYYMGLEQQRFIPEEEAVGDWYDTLYAPLLRVIRDKDILKEFPHRTEADLYLWIMDHQHFLREHYGPGVAAEQAAVHFARRYSTRFLRRVMRVLRRVLRRRKDEESLAPVDAAEGTESGSQ